MFGYISAMICDDIINTDANSGEHFLFILANDGIHWEWVE